MTELRIEPPSQKTLPALLKLELQPGEERFVAPNVESLAEAYVTPTAWPRVILRGDDVIGFVMANFDPENELEPFRCGIWRLSVAAAAQGTGAGRFAVEEVAREALRRGWTRMTVLWEQGDGGPERFYLKCGFEPTGERLFGEVVGARTLTSAGSRR